MKEHVEKHKKKYTLLVFLIFAAVIVFLVLAGLNIFSSVEKPKGKLDLDFGDKNIVTGDSTSFLVGAKNTGKLPLSGKFVAEVDDPSSVTLSYSSPELLSFELLPGESIVRVMNVTATSKAYKTMYKITVSIEGDNVTYSSDYAILTVRKE
ncbi:MAG: hypothetical protein ACP5N3_03505 [Candidatus Nanoarchaeia archaeon]